MYISSPFLDYLVTISVDRVNDSDATPYLKQYVPGLLPAFMDSKTITGLAVIASCYCVSFIWQAFSKYRKVRAWLIEYRGQCD
jgi:hypothetical protein